MKKLTIIVVIAIIVIVLISVFSTKPSSPAGSKEPIKIGAVLSLTGDAAPWGESAKNGIDLAVKDINSKGGIDGRKVQVVIEDDHTDAKNAVSAYNKLVNVDHVSGVIGSVFDFNTQPLLPLAENNKIALITPPNFQIKGSFDLGSQSFSMLVNFDDMVSKYGDFLKQDKIRKLAVVHFTSTWGVEISKVLGNIMQSYGKSKPIEEAYTKIGGNDFKTTILKLKNEGVDTVFFDMLGDDSLNFLKRSKELGFKPTFLTYIGALEIFNGEQDKSLIENVALVNWEISSREFDEMYRKEYGTKPGKSADKSFDALYVMATSIANTTRTSEVADYIAHNSFVTPNSTIAFMPDHTVNSTPIEIDIVKNGELAKWVK
jgi:branched-chain amino acid transport system substrate-binding protein